MSTNTGWLRKRWLPVAGDGCGNRYVLVCQRVLSPVLFVDVIADPDGAAYVAGSSLWHFLNFLFLSELGESSWPFDREAVMQLDPEITRVNLAPLPWKV